MRERTRIAILSGPYSDDYEPARRELSKAMDKVRLGDTNVVDHITAADTHLQRAQDWTRKFIGMKE